MCVFVTLCLGACGWELAKSDVTTAFLQAPMHQKKLPQLLPKKVPKDWKPCMTARAIKAVYGLVDARIYTSFLKNKIEKFDWVQVAESILIKHDKTGQVTALMIMHCCCR
eukprot:GHVR01123163.1.p1 GENE.GHVR01123163.1~~GHVR01123163.1.p1  ORF type:complete len:110 (+),score=10.12 GHVR01123163.1:1131-1460(+)